MEPFQAGAIEVFNQVIDSHTKNGWRDIRGKIGMVFQSYDLFPNMSVIKNVTLGPVKVQKRKVSEVLTAARALLKEVGLAEYENAYPRNLSGGQKQRVAIVRALILRPSLILFDEITASLDPEMVRGVLEILKKLADGKLTMVVVTHEMNFAQQIADQVVFLEEGKIVEIGGGQDFFDQPKTLRAQQFLESMSF
ncbi:ABC-type polar amino acid transport system,ATPase component [Leuconostoc pseudomesenteroides 4882]|nr:ABC-type polar amino acid transport system,ATPase component [Leuconostoc pseudomesenteroides 4882]